MDNERYPRFKHNRVLITGVCGSIGEAVASVLSDEGIRIVGLDKDPLPNDFAAPIENHLEADIRGGIPRSALQHTDALVHLAGWVHQSITRPGDGRRIFEINAEATERIAGTCKDTHTFMVLASTVAVYGIEQWGQVTEQTPACPDSDYAKSKHLAENHVLDIGGTVLRLPMSYGARDRGNMAKMLSAIRDGWFIVPGRGDARRSFVGRWNAAGAIERVLACPEAAGNTYLVTDNEDVVVGQLADICSDLLGSRPPHRLPKTLLNGVGVVGEVITRITSKDIPLNRSSIRKLTRDLYFSSAKLRNELGYSPRKTLREGLEEEIGWLFQAGAE